MKNRFDKYRTCWRLLISVYAFVLVVGVAEIIYMCGSFFQRARGGDLDLLPIIGLYTMVLFQGVGLALYVFMLKCLSCPCCHKLLVRKFWNFGLIKKILKEDLIRCPSCMSEIDTRDE